MSDLCPTCGGETVYQSFSGGREWYCKTCDTTGPYPDTSPPSQLPASPTPGSKTDHPPFSGDDPTCPKCGNVGASTKFLGFGACQHGTGMVLGYQPNERLHRECRRCEFRWDEALAEPRQQGDANT